MMLTAIFGGTFNPFHIGHYAILSALQQDSEIGSVLVMPDRIPPHKVCNNMAQDADRIAMCRLAAEDFPKASVCLEEFSRSGKSYSYDTVKTLKNRHPETDYTFVMGGDMLVYFDKWYRFEELMQLLPFTVFRRVDTDPAEFDACIQKFTAMGMKLRVMPQTVPMVSSTDIRADITANLGLLPPKIADYISERGIYRAESRNR